MKNTLHSSSKDKKLDNKKASSTGVFDSVINVTIMHEPTHTSVLAV